MKYIIGNGEGMKGREFESYTEILVGDQLNIFSKRITIISRCFVIKDRKVDHIQLGVSF